MIPCCECCWWWWLMLVHPASPLSFGLDSSFRCRKTLSTCEECVFGAAQVASMLCFIKWVTERKKRTVGPNASKELFFIPPNWTQIHFGKVNVWKPSSDLFFFRLVGDVSSIYLEYGVGSPAFQGSLCRPPLLLCRLHMERTLPCEGQIHRRWTGGGGGGGGGGGRGGGGVFLCFSRCLFSPLELCTSLRWSRQQLHWLSEHCWCRWWSLPLHRQALMLFYGQE